MRIKSGAPRISQNANTSGHAIMMIMPRELRKEPVEKIDKISGSADSPR